MSSANFDVVVVGAGAAGISAAISLARSGFGVAVVEAAPFPGAENWSGCVYFAESLAHTDLLGPEGVEALAWERRLVERGFFATDGHGLLGMTYRDKAAFPHCYTVLRPIYDHHLAQVAIRHGVVILNSTTVESLIREEDRVIGVCTNRGPLYTDLVFLAEGDASHLVTREGYERFSDPRQSPKFLQGIKQILEFPPGELERRFKLGPEEGAAYEVLLRNGTLHGKPVHLNMGGFVYTNRQSLSVGLVLPADNLHEHFEGDPNLLLEWFLNLPSLQHWFRGAKQSVFGAKLIRGGGAREIPTLIDNGLAIGGAASAIGIDFPYPNFTGPATAMGLLLGQAARRIRQEGGGFTKDNLRRHYLEPLQKTHYWQDVEFLSRWPRYVKTTTVFFGINLDLTLQTAYLWTRTNQGVFRRWINWLRLLVGMAASDPWRDLKADYQQLEQALRIREVVPRPTFWRLLLDGSLNAVRDLLRIPRAEVSGVGKIDLHFSVAAGSEPAGLPPGPLRGWFNRFAPVLAAAAKMVYSNNEVPLAHKLSSAVKLLFRQVNLLDVVTAGFVGAVTGITSQFMRGWKNLQLRKADSSPQKPPVQPGKSTSNQSQSSYSASVQQAVNMTPHLANNVSAWEARLAKIHYESGDSSHIHVLWPKTIQGKDKVTSAGLWHVCPAHVYEARINPTGQLQVVVNFENCIKCETCWRTSGEVDWGRDGEHRFVYAVSSASVSRLLEGANASGLAQPTQPNTAQFWSTKFAFLPTQGDKNKLVLPPKTQEEVLSLADILERKTQELESALAEEPRTIDSSRSEYLDMLARYIQQVTTRLVELLQDSIPPVPSNGQSFKWSKLLHLARDASKIAEQCTRHAWNRRFSWAVADGRQLRWHHVPGLRFLFNQSESTPSKPPAEPPPPWLLAEKIPKEIKAKWEKWKSQLDGVFPSSFWRELEKKKTLSSSQDNLLRTILAQIPEINPENLSGTLHSLLRKLLLADLGGRDPSLAFRVASHLWARDIATLAGFPEEHIHRFKNTEEWGSFAYLQKTNPNSEEQAYQAIFGPAGETGWLLYLQEDNLSLVTIPPDPGKDFKLKPLDTLGLRGAGISQVNVGGSFTPDHTVVVNPDDIQRIWVILSAADLTSIASGMTELLLRRVLEHANSRVQFPGLFHDEESRDSIAKFGAIKKMVAEIGARRYLIETLDYNLSPVDLAPETATRAALVKALVAEALGTAPGSVSYNAGQIFGGTAYSEDDLLSKYYRDAAAWRFLGPDNVQTFLERGQQLLSNWELEKQSFGLFPGEELLFEAVDQRKALQAELEELRLHRSLCCHRVADWLAVFQTSSVQPFGPLSDAGQRENCQTEFLEALGRQDAFFLVSNALLFRTHSRLEFGIYSETEAALLRVWLEFTSQNLSEFDGLVERHLQLIAPWDERPVVDPALGPPITSYQDFLDFSTAYQSGDFLVHPVNLNAPRYVPEMNETDPHLAEAERRIQTELEKHFGGLHEGLVYERFIEKQHRPEEEDLVFLRRQGYFRMPIPSSLGGEGKSKAEYYLLTTNAHRLADVAVSLTIQVNSSLGTTPVLLAREKDLPRAQKEVEGFIQNKGLQTEISQELKELQETLEHGISSNLESQFSRINHKLEEAALKSAPLRVLANPLVGSWQRANEARRRYDLGALKEAIALSQQNWSNACEQAPDYLEELRRRIQACDLFLRWVASGHISAFALTEPSAGSDTARVATYARLRSAPVEVEPEGRFRFLPVGGKEPRYLLDASRLEFRSVPEKNSNQIQPFYRWSKTAEPAQICFDEYDYETDNPHRRLYFLHGTHKHYFTDIAQLRQREGQLWYDYWELTGSKMWITNGRMCGIMCLYAKTEEGVTGFIVDRHAEGLVVGKDEEKMGQCGSPTNELSLQNVRVPRENVIGLEGRGQVNALETLNVGRAGLAMSAMCQMQRIIGFCRDYASTPLRTASSGDDETGALLQPEQKANGQFPPWIRWRLQRMEEDSFISEALAYDIIGRFEHKQTKSVRLESAVAKMLVSELLHGLIERAEEIHGLAGQTQLHLIEKRKRDARVLNIYEGTNEIQRFFILRDLIGEVARRWSKEPAQPASGYLGREALAIEHLKAKLREVTEASLELFGQQLAINPNLQANCFLLAEAVAWLAAADSTLARLAWLIRREAEEEADWSPQVKLGIRSFIRCSIEVRDRLKRFEEELAHLRRGFYAPEVRAASLLLRKHQQPKQTSLPASKITRPLAILVVMGTPVPATTEPVVVNGELQEPYLVFSEADRAALETALMLRERAQFPCNIQVITSGTARVAHHLREVLNLGVTRARLLLTPEQGIIPEDRIAAAMARILKEEPPFELIIGGQSSSSPRGYVTSLVGEALGIPFHGEADQVAVQIEEDETLVLLVTDQKQRIRALPACITVTEKQKLRKFNTQGFLDNLSRSVEVVPWPAEVPLPSSTLVARQIVFSQAEATESPRVLLPLEAGHLVIKTLGLDNAPPAGRKTSAREDASPLDIAEVPIPVFAKQEDAFVLAILASDAQGKLRPSAAATLRAAQFIFYYTDSKLAVLALVPLQQSLQHECISQLASLTSARVVLFPFDVAHPDEVKGKLLVDSWSSLNPTVRAVVGEPWTEHAFIKLVAQDLSTQRLLIGVSEMNRYQGNLLIETPNLGDKICLQETLSDQKEAVWWLTVTDEAVVGTLEDKGAFAPPQVERWQPKLDRFYGREDVQRLLAELKVDTGLVNLSEAEFIIDVGFGVGNQDGYEAVIVPLEKALREIGVRQLVIGGSRKVTEEMHLLAEDRQIGQSGVSVNPRLLLAIGISGAPQHLNYIGPRATIIAFNRDPEAPIMTLNRRQAQPRVYPVVGDLFETVPAFVESLRLDSSLQLPSFPRKDVTTPQ